METATQERTNGDGAAFSIDVTRPMIGPMTELAIIATKERARLVTQASERLQTAAVDAGRRVRETLEESFGLRETTRR